LEPLARKPGVFYFCIMTRLPLLLSCLLLTCTTLGQSYQPGQSYFSPDGFIEYRCGNLPLIITAPHGGYLLPDSLPDRNCPGITTVQDAHTLELAQTIDSVYVVRDNCRPHVIISHLHRLKMDANRDSVDGSCGNAKSLAAWQAFHHFVQAARDSIQAKQGKGLLLDIHGHGHVIQRIELGYQLTGEHLRSGDSAINSAFRVQRSGIRSLVANNLGALTHSQLLRGQDAFGTYLAAAGYPSVPSLNDTAPQPGEPFFSGAYITERHGSQFSGNIDAIQLEHYLDGIRNTAANRFRYADSLRLLTNRFLSTHYFGNLDFLTFCRGSSNSVQTVEKAENWQIYPNPGQELTLRTTETGQLRIYNLSGQMLYQAAFSPGEHRPEVVVPPGIYLVQWQHQNQVATYKRWVKY
jgi:hypothetical protein